MSKRLAIFLPSLAGGGAERAMVRIANLLAARGYDIDLCTASFSGPYVREVASNVRIVNLNSGSVAISLIPLICYLHRNRPDAILSAMTHANVIAVLSKIFMPSKIRIVISERAHISQSLKITSFADWKNIVLSLLVRVLYPFADAICAVSEGVARDLETYAKLPPNSARCIYNPFDIDQIDSLARESISHPWFCDGGPPIILSVGRLTHQKNFSLLIRSFKLVRKSIKCRLLIMGEGVLHSKLYQESVDLLLTNDDIQIIDFRLNPFPYFTGSSVFVLPSLFEGLPAVLIEAMACGTPVISTDCPSGPREILDNGVYGSLVPVNDEQLMAQAIIHTLQESKSNSKDVKKRAEFFNCDSIIQEYICILGL